MGRFTRMWKKVWGSRRDASRANKSRSLRLESLEDRALLSVTTTNAIDVVAGAVADAAIVSNDFSDFDSSAVIQLRGTAPGTAPDTGFANSDTVRDTVRDTVPIDLISVELPASTQLTPPEFATVEVEAQGQSAAITVSWTTVENAESYTLRYKKVTQDDSGWATFTGLAGDSSFTIDGLERGMKYDIQVKAVAASGSSYADSSFAATTAVTPLPELNLADYAEYTNFLIDANAESVCLYAVREDGQVLIPTLAFFFIGRKASLTLHSDNTARNVRIAQGAAMNLDSILYVGGTTKNDTILIDGSDARDVFALSQVTRTVDVHTRPSAKVQTKDVAFDTVRVFSEFDTNAIPGPDSNGVVFFRASIEMSGVSVITINAKGGNDTFEVVQIGTTYDLKGGEGADDALDFTRAQKGARVNLGQKTAQSVISGQKGKLILHQDKDAIESIVGSKFKDKITTAASTIYVSGGGDADSVTLVGDVKTKTEVHLSGNSQKVTAKGNGYFTVEILDGDKSAVTASSHKGESTKIGDLGHTVALRVVAYGDNIRVTGSKGNDDICVYGNNAKVQGGEGNDLISVTGDKANVQGGAGDDKVAVVGNNANIQGNDGDDMVVFGGENAKVNGGKGGDMLFLYYATGKNTIDGGADDDLIIGSRGDDTIKSTSGNNVMFGYGGADKITGGNGRNLIFANSASQIEKDLDAAGRPEQLPADLKDLECLAPTYLTLFNTWRAGAPAKEITKLCGDESIIDHAQDTLKRGGTETVFYANTNSDQDTANVREEKDTLFNKDAEYQPKLS